MNHDLLTRGEEGEVLANPEVIFRASLDSRHGIAYPFFALDALAFGEFDGQNGVQVQGPVAFDREESSGDDGEKDE